MDWWRGGYGTQLVQELANGLWRWRRVNVVIFDGFAAENFADGFDLLGVFSLFALKQVARIADGAAAVAELVEFKDFVADPAEHGEDGEGLFGVEVVGAKEDLREAGGHDLEADFRESGGVRVEEVGECILLEAGVEDEGLVEAPLVVAAAGGPIGDVAGSDFEAAFGEGLSDFVVGDGVGEHAVDHIAFEFGEAGDFAVARFGFGGPGLGGVRFGQDGERRRLGVCGRGCGIGNDFGWFALHNGAGW